MRASRSWKSRQRCQVLLLRLPYPRFCGFRIQVLTLVPLHIILRKKNARKQPLCGDLLTIKVLDKSAPTRGSHRQTKKINLGNQRSSSSAVYLRGSNRTSGIAEVLLNEMFKRWHRSCPVESECIGTDDR